jgi:peptide-methionine (S)-S-oxide reductase
MIDKATVAAGCFWQVEAEFRNIPGVSATAVGYTGGHTAEPTYRDVCSDRTAHAEAVRIEFDPDKVSYAQLLDVFWGAHDPTTMNRQGPDIGSQYRSAIFFHSPQQEAVAKASLAAAMPRFPRPIVTEITPAGDFWMAEGYHQQYLEKRGLASCRIPGMGVVEPETTASAS